MPKQDINISTYIAYGLLVILVGLLCLSKIYEDDVFWQLATGRWIVQHNSIPDKDVFGFVTAGKPWIQYEWLWCTFTYLIYTVTQSYGALEILAAIICGGMILLLLLTMRRLKVALPVSILITLLVMFNAVGRYSPRPHLMTMLGLTVTVFVLYYQRYSDQSKPNILFILPFVFLVWANMHPGVLAGLVVLAIAIVSEVLRIILTRPPSTSIFALYSTNEYLKKLLLVALLCACATLVNPQGINTFLAIAGRTHSDFWNKIVEWQSPFSPHINMMQIWFYKILFVAGSVSIYYAWKKKDPLPALLYVAFALYSVRAVRLRVDFAAVTAPGTALGLHYLIGNIRKDWLHKFMRRKALTAVLVGFCILLIALIPGGQLYGTMNVSTQFGLGLDSTALPIAMMDFMKREHINGRPFNERGVGGMLIWNFPDEKNFIDGRDLNDEIVNEYSSMYQLEDGFEKKFEQHGIDHVLIFIPGLDKNAELITTSPVPYLSTHRDVWKLVYWDDRSYLYLKNIPKFQRVVEQYEYKALHPYLFAYCPHAFDSLRARLPKDFRQEVERKLGEEPNGRVVQFIVNEAQN